MTSFADILGGPRHLTLQGGLQVSYLPAVVTPALMSKILAGVDSDDPAASLAAYRDTIPVFLDSWDLEDDGVPVPITPEGVDNVPLAILNLVLEGILEDRDRRASEEGNASSGSMAASRPASTIPSSTGSRPNGSVSSTLPASTAAARGSS